MKTILKKLGLDSILRIDNRFLGWIEPYERVSLWRNFISEDEILKDLNFGVR